MAFKSGARGEGNAAVHVDDLLRAQGNALVAVENVARELKILPLAGGAIEFDQRHLDLRMPGDNPLLVWSRSEVGKQKTIDKPHGRVEQRAVSVGTIESDGALQHVADAIELVSGGLRVVLHAQRLAVVLVVGVEVAARLLDGHHVANHGGGGLAQLRLVGGLQREADGLGPLVDVGVGVDGTLLRRAGLAFEAQEVVHAAVREQLVAHGGDAGVEIGLAALRPEAVLDGDRSDRNAFQLGVRRAGKIEDAGVFPIRDG